MNLRPCGIHAHIRTARKQYHENTDYHQRNEQRAEPKREQHEHNATAEQQKISSEPKNREDRGIFNNLEELQIKGNHQRINIETHENIQHDNQNRGKEEHVVICVVAVIERQSSRAHHKHQQIQDTHGKRLFP